MAYKSQPTVTRPANVTAYTAGDVVGGAIALSGIEIGSSPKDILISSAALRVYVGSIPAGMTSFRLHLYSVTPPSALADNDAWDLPAGDRASYQGYVDLGSPADVGSTLVAQVDGVNKQVSPGTGNGVTGLYGYLVTNGAFTPAGNSEVYVLEVHAIDA